MMLHKILVYGPPTSRVAKVLWTLGEAKVPFERDERTPAVLKQDADYMLIQPKGTVPTLVVTDKAGAQFVCNESNTIVSYLSSKLSPGELYPSTPESVANAWQWLEWGEQLVAPQLSPIWFGLVRRGAYPPGSSNTLVVEKDTRGSAAKVNHKSVSEMLRAWTQLESHLADGKRHFIQGGKLSMADITAGVHANRLFHLPVDEMGVDPRKSLPHVHGYYQRLCERDPYQKYVVPYGGAPKK
jgi:glutathione S-transferase